MGSDRPRHYSKAFAMLGLDANQGSPTPQQELASRGGLAEELAGVQGALAMHRTGATSWFSPQLGNLLGGSDSVASDSLGLSQAGFGGNAFVAGFEGSELLGVPRRQSDSQAFSSTQSASLLSGNGESSNARNRSGNDPAGSLGVFGGSFDGNTGRAGVFAQP